MVELIRAHWGIENGLRYRRDVTFGEDSCRLRFGHAAPMMASLDKSAIGLICQQRHRKAAEATVEFCASPMDALATI